MARLVLKESVVCAYFCETGAPTVVPAKPESPHDSTHGMHMRATAHTRATIAGLPEVLRW